MLMADDDADDDSADDGIDKDDRDADTDDGDDDDYEYDGDDDADDNDVYDTLRATRRPLSQSLVAVALLGLGIAVALLGRGGDELFVVCLRAILRRLVWVAWHLSWILFVGLLFLLPLEALEAIGRGRVGHCCSRVPKPGPPLAAQKCQS